jgi:ABC-type transport system involved in multi-copper enzyme maturation permease subunit
LRNILAIAVNVIKDTSRKKIFYVVFLFGLVVVALAPLLPTFELGSRASFLRDISLSLTSLFGVVLAVVLSVGQVPGEVDKRTIYNILSKPVSRLQYLLGKYIGIIVSLAAILFVMGLEIIALLAIRVHVFSPVIFQGVFAVFLEAAVISAFCLMLSTFTTVPINVFAAILFYFVCHMKTGYLHQKLVVGSMNGFLKVLADGVYYMIPNLENFNISQRVGYGGGPGAWYMLRVAGYAVVFAAIFLLIGYATFRRKDL